ncbi:MAG: YopX family protein [Candidatus Omnitrophica bacterium]|nr:YopX family protein [Candidatus Omnitrophota bacterium]
MNREIKFRAWDKDASKMFDVNILAIGFGAGAYSYPESNDEEEAIQVGTDDSNRILMQFTGLFDKQGKDIYEGDIIKMMGGYGGDFKTKEFMAVVKYEENGFFATSELPFMYPDHSWWDGCEVIGNIYENKDLLK